MKEIKFRAWDGFTMHRVGQLNWSFRNGITIVQAGNRPWSSNKPWKRIVDPVLMQYTGLKDKNGIEVYEGDIITVTTNHIADLDPKYPEKTTTVEVRCENAVWWFGDMTMIYTPLKNAKLEVIGNIYENPELLEAK